jgi:hypothetical protein
MEHMVRIVGPHCCGVQQHRFGLQNSEKNMQPALQVLAESGSSAKEADLWTRIQSSPVKTAKDLMALEGFADLLGRPWRRAYRSKGLAVEARFADSVQFHCEFQKSTRFTQLLRISGSNKIFIITPKTADGGTDDACRIVWMNCSGGAP